MSCRCHHTTVSRYFSLRLAFFHRGLFPVAKFLLLHPSNCLKLYDDEETSITFVASLNLSSFLSHVSLFYLTFLISSFVSLPRVVSLLSLCGRGVINPYFIAQEFFSPCRADSSPRSKTLLGPNPILPPCITPSLPPSGPDYRTSGRVAGRRGGGRRWRKASQCYTPGGG